MGKKAPPNSRLPSAPCAVTGCTARAQRQFDEPDGARRCIGHSRAPESLRLQRKAGATGRGESDPDGSVELLENRADLAGAPQLMERSEKDFGELLATREGRDYLRAWLFQSVVLKNVEPERVRAARDLLRDIEEQFEKHADVSGWEQSPLYQSLRSLIDAH